MADERARVIEHYFKDLDGEALIEEAQRANLEVAAACAMISKETGGRDIFGADWGRIGADRVPYSHLATTERRVDPLLGYVRRGGVSNGIGVSQITSAPYVFRAEQAGGAHIPRYQMRVGFDVLADNIRTLDRDFQSGAAAYNAGLGNWRSVYPTYGAKVIQLYELWK